MDRIAIVLLSVALLAPPVSALAADGGRHGVHMPAHPKLEPADGAGVKIVAPKKGQVFTGDEVPLEFKLVKGKRGHHVHAYVDGELMGMFEGEKGLLTGIQPGRHTLELRVVADDHTTELQAVDKVEFVVR